MEAQAKLVLIIILSIILGPFFSLFVTPIFCWLRKVYYVPVVNQKILQKAIDKGHTVNASLVKSGDIVGVMQTNVDTSGVVDTGKIMGTYLYEYNGKKYKHHINTRNRLPEEITLYFIKNPRKASLPSEIGYSESNWLLYYLVISIISCIITLIAGMFYLF